MKNESKHEQNESKAQERSEHKGKGIIKGIMLAKSKKEAKDGKHKDSEKQEMCKK